MKIKLISILILSIISMSFKDPIITWGTNQHGLSIALTGSDENIEVHLKNETNNPLEIWTHVQSHEVHYDWFHLIVKDEKNNEYKIELIGSREKSAPISQRLNPQEDLIIELSLIEWINKPINQKKYPKLKLTGKCQVSIIYEVKKPIENKWHGKIEVINHPITIN